MAQKLANFPVVDTHAHLFFDRFDADRAEVIENASRSGVAAIINVGIDVATSRAVTEMAHAHERLFAAVGLHPNDANQAAPDYSDQLAELALNKKVVAIGEIGLDYYWDRCPKNIQRIEFRSQLDLAQRLNLPVIIHNRDAWADTLAILESDYKNKISGVFHCFTGTKDELKRVLDLGFFVSFTGVVTFKNSSALALASKYAPLERLLLETDSPFMAPVPFRGKRCEPAFVVPIAEKIAEARKMDFQELAQATNKNVKKLFGIAGFAL
ncbi:MAG: TatD family hydrolase [Calditrichaeota bacterium]|nr:TatD family hydrolase [Calditrichota bacterium]